MRPLPSLFLALCLFGSLLSWFPRCAAITVHAQSIDTSTNTTNTTSTPTLQNMEKLWKWGGYISFVKSVSGTLYANMGRDLVLFDITDPAAPEELGHVDLDIWFNDIEIVGHYALLAGGSDGFFIVDIHNKRNPILVLERHEPYLVNSIAVVGHYAYVAYEVGGDLTGGVQILDLTQPDAPVVINEQIAGLEFTPIDVQIANGHLFVAGRIFRKVAEIYSTQPAFQAFRLSDPTNPSPLPAHYAEKTFGRSVAYNAILINGDDAYVSYRDGITSFSIHDPTNLFTTTQLTLEGISTQPLQRIDNRLYVVRPPDLTTGSSHDSGIYVLDISLPTSPHIQKFLPQPVTAITTQQSQIYIARNTDGLYLLDTADPLASSPVGIYKAPSILYANLATHQQTLYVTGGIWGTPLLSTVDLSMPTEPTLSQIVTGTERVSFAPFVGDNKLVASLFPSDTDVNAFNTYHVFDITDPNRPQRLAQQTILPFVSTAYANHLFYVETPNPTLSTTQIRSYDLSDPANPIQKDVFSVLYNSVAGLHSFYVDDNYLYHVGDTEPDAKPRQWTPRLNIYALSNGQSVGSLELPQRISELYHDSNILYAVTYWQTTKCGYTIYLIDITDPTTPYLRQNLCWSRKIDELLLDDNLLYIADRDTTYKRKSETGLSILDFTIPHAPRLAGYAYEPSSLAQVVKMGDTIYFSGFRLGAYRYSPPRATAQLNHTASTLDASFDHVTYHFAADIFTTTVTVTHTTRFVDPDLAFPTPWLGIGSAFSLAATATNSGEVMQPQQLFSITMTYAEEDVKLVDEDTLALYRWTGERWVKEEGSQVHPNTNTVTVSTQTTGIWMLSARSPGRQYLPLVVN